MPLATVAIAGGRNAGLLGVKILASSDPALRERVFRFKRKLAAESRSKNLRLQAELS